VQACGVAKGGRAPQCEDDHGGWRQAAAAHGAAWRGRTAAHPTRGDGAGLLTTSTDGNGSAVAAGGEGEHLIGALHGWAAVGGEAAEARGAGIAPDVLHRMQANKQDALIQALTADRAGGAAAAHWTPLGMGGGRRRRVVAARRLVAERARGAGDVA
jgi:hypothetical protein